jgi:glutamine synthetase
MVVSSTGPKIAEPQTSPKDVIAQAKQLQVKMIDFKFVDLPGLWQHFSIPADEFNEALFSEGIGFDGSSIRGFQKIHESDMLLLPDPDTAFLDPACTIPTLAVICDVISPGTMERYSRDARFVAKKAEAFLRESGIATAAYYGPELEFYIFNSIRFGQDTRSGFYEIDSVEGIWNSSKDGTANLGYRPRYKEGYFPVPPMDKLQDLRSEIVLEMQKAGMKVEVHHHEVGTAGQTEIDMLFTTLVKMADQVMKYKYIVKNVCYRNGYTATFMPKPLFGDNGSGMHTHQSLWKDDQPLFYDANGYAMISEMCRHYIGGLLKHTPSILGFAAPTTNSYRRLVPGYEAPINLVYSQRNRSACVRIPTYSPSPRARRLEFRAPDGACNPYLAFACMLMAGLDGVINKIEPPDPIDEDLYELLAHEDGTGPKVQSTPGSLPEVLDALEADHEYLLRGGVFTQDVIDEWIAYKREREVDAVALRPHPWEFHLYYDI